MKRKLIEKYLETINLEDFGSIEVTSEDIDQMERLMEDEDNDNVDVIVGIYLCVKEYLASINLNDYDLGGVEITEDDMYEMAKKVLEQDDATPDEIVDEYLYGVRTILDEGLDDIEDEDDFED